ncbi:MAG TPA: cell division protein FtsH, partial [Ktedonobacterales bacterium]|nr:cell division protein FtsH [Ktedonobacterales bacterium]
MTKRLWTRGGVVLALAGVVAVLLLIFGMQQTNQPRDVDLSTMLADIKIDVVHQQVDTLSVNTNQLVLVRADGKQERTSIGAGFQLGDALKRDGGIDYTNPKVLKVDYSDPSPANALGSVLMTLVPIVLIGLLLYFFIRQMQGGNSQAISFGKSRARMFNTSMPVVTFSDVAGVEEA